VTNPSSVNSVHYTYSDVVLIPAVLLYNDVLRTKATLHYYYY